TSPVGVTLAVIDSSAAEGSPADTGKFRVTRSGSTAAPLTVSYQVSGAATNGQDYSSLSGTVTIATGQTSADIDIVPVDDTIFEGPENVHVQLTAGTGYVVGTPSAGDVGIADNDAAPQLSVADGGATEGNNGTINA